MTRPIVFALVLPGLISLVGCSRGLDVATYQTRTIEPATPDQVLDAAVGVLRREFPRLTVDRERRTIVSAPAEYNTLRDSGTARDLVRARSRMRRVAHFNVLARQQGALAQLRVDIERQDTAQRVAVQSDRYRLSDSPAYTPIERDAGTTAEQNTVWTRVRRDRQLERALLDELQEQFASVPATPDATQTSSEPAQ